MSRPSWHSLFAVFLFLVSLSSIYAQVAVQQDELVLEPSTTDADMAAFAPEIIISHPSPKDVFKIDTVSVYGTLRSAAKIERLVLMVNNEREFPVAGVESWEARVTLVKGANHIVVTAVDATGNAAAKAEVIVYYVPPDVVASIAEKEAPEILKRETVKKRIITSKLADLSRLEKDRYMIDRESAPLERAAIEIKLRPAVEGVSIANDLLVEEYTDVPSDMAADEKSAVGLSTDEELLGSFVRIESNLTEMDWAVVKIRFTEEELKLKRLARERLFMVWYDDNPGSPSYGRWVRLRKGHPVWVHDVGINRTGGYVWANVSHFSVYGIGGRIETSTPTPTPTTIPPETTPPPATAPPTHFPEETPRPTVSAQPTDTPGHVLGSPSPERRASSVRKMRKRIFLLILLIIILFLAVGLSKRGKKEPPLEEEPPAHIEKDLLSGEETPPDDNPDD